MGGLRSSVRVEGFLRFIRVLSFTGVLRVLRFIRVLRVYTGFIWGFPKIGGP